MSVLSSEPEQQTRCNFTLGFSKTSSSDRDFIYSYLLYQIICTHLEPDHGDSWAWLDSPRPLASLNLCRKKYCIWMKCVDKNTWRNQGLMNVYVTRASFKSAEAQQDVSLIISLNDWSVMKCQFSLTSIHFSWLLFGREDYFCPNNQWGVVYTSHMCHFQSTWK